MKLEVKEIRKNFGEKEVLHGVSFAVESGKALGLLGRNGAGKTTTIRILMDVFHANSGEILLDGRKFMPSRHQIGYLPEERGLYPKRTVMDQMIYLACLRGMKPAEAKESAGKWLDRLEVKEYAPRKLETLSKGNQQKVQILKDVVGELIRDNHLVIFSSHQMSYVEEFCDQIAVIDHGEVVMSGELKEIRKEYGRNRLMLAAENYTLDALAEKTEREWNAFVKVSGRKKEFLILELKEGTDRRRFMEQLVKSDVEVEKFGGYEPSLNDIFVSKVGEEA